MNYVKDGGKYLRLSKWHTVEALPSTHHMPATATAPISPQQTCPQLSQRELISGGCQLTLQREAVVGVSQTMHRPTE